MTDIKSSKERSKNMAAIKSTNTKPEILFRHWLFSLGLRYRINAKNIYGHPDLFLKKYNVAVFINGCFWHRHEGCHFSYNPKSNIDFWNKKFENNKRRDKVVKDALKEQKVRQAIIWECTIKEMNRDTEHKDLIIQEFIDFLNGNQQYFEI